MKPISARYSLYRVLAAITLLLCMVMTGEAYGQGFMVKPMRIEVAPAPGRQIEIPVEIQNTAGDGARDIELRLVELSQGVEGGWRLIEPDSGEDVSQLYSSVSWASLPVDRISIEPLQAATISVQVNVPVDAKGAYFAGLIAETPLPADPQGIVVRVRFLIPLIVEIAGRTVRQQVSLANVEMSRVDAIGATPGSTKASLVIVNEGRTFSRVKGKLSIESRNGDTWRLVTRLDVPERSIIPGVTLQLGDDINRRLPTGTYRLKGELSVDGRRLPQMVKEVEFTGDASADAVAFDTALLLEPLSVSMDVLPGATRTTTVAIANPGPDPIRVSMESVTPLGMLGVEMGQIRGTDLSAQPWTEIRPAEFTIRPGGRQNVRVISRIPEDGVQYPNYYASLVLKGVYPDGQSAGETRSTLHLANVRGESRADAVVDQLSISEGPTPTQYIIQSRIANIGNVHILPLARAFLLTPQGRQTVVTALAGDDGMILPLGKRTYGAEIDLAGVEPGYYALRVTFDLGDDKEVSKQQVVLVGTQEIVGPDGQKVVVPMIAVDPDATEFPDGVDVDTEPPQPLDTQVERSIDNEIESAD
jgi:hypothetical protein